MVKLNDSFKFQKLVIEPLENINRLESGFVVRSEITLINIAQYFCKIERLLLCSSFSISEQYRNTKFSCLKQIKMESVNFGNYIDIFLDSIPQIEDLSVDNCTHIQSTSVKTTSLLSLVLGFGQLCRLRKLI